MILGIDHVVILVNDLTQAIDDYTALGFTVTPGGEHADGSTHNALIVFADGSYLELLAFQRPTPEHHWWRHVEIGEGLIDWALLPDAISEDIEAARDAGVPFTGPIPGGRLRPDGQQIAWEMGFPQMQGLPFLCGDITPRALRVPDGAARKHANGAVGIATITIAVNDIHASLPACRALLNVRMRGESGVTHAAPPPGFIVPEAGAQIALLPIGTATIMLAEPRRLEPPAEPALPPGEIQTLHHQLITRGDGPYALTLRISSQQSKTPAFDPSLTHGVRLDAVQG